MSTFLTAKDILQSYDVLNPKKDGARHPAREFQAYGYRLAADLNDLENLKIYLRLAKTQDRTLLERAYSFVADVNSTKKGALFLWKLKQLRAENQSKKDSVNFDYKFVVSRMRKLRNDLAESICEKNDRFYISSQRELFTRIFEESLSQERRLETTCLPCLASRQAARQGDWNNPSLPSPLIKGKVSRSDGGVKRPTTNDQRLNILLLGNSCRAIISDLASYKVKIFGLEISNKITNILKLYAKDFCPDCHFKFISKDFLENTYPNEQFDLLVMNNYWNSVPEAEESKVLAEVKRILKPTGRIVIHLKLSDINELNWKKMDINGKSSSYFEKNTTLLHFEELLTKLQLEVISCKERTGFCLYEIKV